MDEAGDLFHLHTGLPLPGILWPNPKIVLVVLLSLVHLAISLPIFILVGAGCRDQDGIENDDLVHRYALCSEVGFDGFKDLYAFFVILQQASLGLDRCLILVPITVQLDAGNTAHVATAIRASTMSGSLNEYHCCNRWIRNMVANGYGALPPFLLVSA